METKILIARSPLNHMPQTIDSAIREIKEFVKNEHTYPETSMMNVIAHSAAVIDNANGTYDLISPSTDGVTRYQNVQITEIADHKDYRVVKIIDRYWTLQKKGTIVCPNMTSEKIHEHMTQWVNSRGGYSVVRTNCHQTVKEAINYSTSMCIPIEHSGVCARINRNIGNINVIDSTRLGQSYKNVVNNIVDFLGNNIPHNFIDTTQPLTIRNNNMQIDFAPKEVKFISNLVGINQMVTRCSNNLLTTSKNIVSTMDSYLDSSLNRIATLDSNIAKIQVDMNRNVESIHNFEPITPTNNIRFEQLRQNKNTVVNHDYSDAVAQHPNGHVSVKCNNDGFYIGFSISVGGGGVGGFSCNLL